MYLNFIYNRETKELEKEKEYGKKLLDFLYRTVVGRILLKLIFARPWFSKLQSIYYNSKRSKKKIEKFIRDYNIDASYWIVPRFRTFNEFFTRKRKISDYSQEEDLVAIADSKLSVYKVDEDLKLRIKRTEYTVGEILGNDKLANEFKNGTCLVFRLGVDDYHRYHFIDDGKVLNHYKIKGTLHSVRPIYGQRPVYVQNCREITEMQTNRLDKVVQVEVGAMLVGKINNHQVSEFKKLQEKGYFEYGGSTIVVFLSKDVKIDDDIMKQSLLHTETKVKIGERIGTIC